MADKTVIAITVDIWSADALVAKFQRYIDEAKKHDTSDWQYGLWCALAIEALTRAALAKVSPVLLGDASDWNNIYFGLGHQPSAKRFVPKSISTSEVLSRLENIIPEFGSEAAGFVKLLTSRRNAELHSAEAPFDNEGASKWLAKFYRTVFILLKSLGVKPSAIFGSGELEYANKLIAAADDDTAKAVMGTIAAHKTVWEGKTDEERATLKLQADTWATQHAGHRAACPSCGCTALLFGEPIEAPAVTYDGNTITEKQRYLPYTFECVGCGLKIHDFSRLNAAGLGDEFTGTQEYDPSDYFTSSDEFEWEPDYNE
jgi:hypothetical protein